jgi:hypothetical protein
MWLLSPWPPDPSLPVQPMRPRVKTVKSTALIDNSPPGRVKSTIVGPGPIPQPSGPGSAPDASRDSQLRKGNSGGPEYELGC